MRLEITPNFLSQDECKVLNTWACLGIENKWIDKGICTGKFIDKRFTSRLYAHRFEYPKQVLELSNKIRNFAGVADYQIIEDHGKNGVVVSYTKPGGDVYKHKDPKQFGAYGMSALRCNIMTQDAEDGAELFVNNEKVNIKAGDLHCYLASDFEHYVTEVKGNTPRILWMFGAYVPKNDWENGGIKYGLS